MGWRYASPSKHSFLCRRNCPAGGRLLLRPGMKCADTSQVRLSLEQCRQISLLPGFRGARWGFPATWHDLLHSGLEQIADLTLEQQPAGGVLQAVYYGYDETAANTMCATVLEPCWNNSDIGPCSSAVAHTGRRYASKHAAGSRGHAVKATRWLSGSRDPRINYGCHCVIQFFGRR